MLKGLIGKKIGMTQIFDDVGIAIPITLIEAGPCYVTQVREVERDGYSAVQLGYGEVSPKRLTGGQLGHLKRNDLAPLRHLREFQSKNPEVSEGDRITVEVFSIGDHVDVVGRSKGRGFAGAVKRYGFAGGQKPTGSPTDTELSALLVPLLAPRVFSPANVCPVTWDIDA
jgi:large subunit ribosomal protein L3